MYVGFPIQFRGPYSCLTLFERISMGFYGNALLHLSRAASSWARTCLLTFGSAARANCCCRNWQLSLSHRAGSNPLFPSGSGGAYATKPICFVHPQHQEAASRKVASNSKCQHLPRCWTARSGTCTFGSHLSRYSMTRGVGFSCWWYVNSHVPPSCASIVVVSAWVWFVTLGFPRAPRRSQVHL